MPSSPRPPDPPSSSIAVLRTLGYSRPMDDAPSTCRMCGGRLRWDPGEVALVCPHCGTVNQREAPPAGPWGIEPAGKVPRNDLRTLLDTARETRIEETATVPCPGCGAEITFDAGTLAEDCPFCATPLARSAAHRHRHPKPEGVLPFALTEREARERLKAWLSSRWFAPNGLRQYAGTGRPLAGTYVPHYAYDAHGQARYRGQRGRAYWVSTGMGKNRRRERRIDWTPVSGEVSERFRDVLIPASDTLGAKAAQSALQGWDMAGLVPHAPRYLAGFRAEMPSLEVADGWAAARERMTSWLRQQAMRDIGGDEQRINALDARFRDEAFAHVLLPVWLAAYRYRGQSYTVAINGRTGKVAGERPYSGWKIALAVAAGLLIAAALFWINSR